MNIIEALRDRSLFGKLKAFRDLGTWQPWLTFLAAFYGLPLDVEGVERFKKHTGRSVYNPPPGGWREAVAVVARQSGKSRIGATVADFEAMSGEDGTSVLLIAQDFRAALRVALRYVKEPFESVRLLRASVADTKTDTLTLKNGVMLAAYPCRPPAVRGLRCSCVVCDELAFFKTSDGVAQDREMLTALRPTLATTNGRLLILSSPYAQTGALWDLFRAHHGRDESPVLIWQASAPDMNPTLRPDYLARMQESDPLAYASEVLGEFRQGVTSLFDVGALDAVVVPYVEHPYTPGVHYLDFCDPSGGRGDSFTLTIGHAHDGRVVVDLLRAWRPPFNPSGVVAEAVDLLKAFRLTAVMGDRYSGEWVTEAFRVRGVTYTPCELPKSDLYLGLLAAVNSRAIDVPDVPDLLRELRGLERRRGNSGKDHVDHGPNQHDDLANSLAGLVHAVPAQRLGGLLLTGGMMQTEKERLAGVLVEDSLVRSAARWAAIERGPGGARRGGGLVI